MRPIAPPEPEPAASTYFQPVPMRPVFGMRSEQPDGIEAESKPLSPEELAPRPLTPNLLLPIPQSPSGGEGSGGDMAPPHKDGSDEGDEGGVPETDEPADRPPTAGRGQLRFPKATTAATVSGWRIAQRKMSRDE